MFPKKKPKSSLQSLLPDVHPFLIAIGNNDKENVSKMIKEGVNVNMHLPDGSRTPLHVATHLGHKEIVLLLLSNKADVHALSDDGQTALHVAAQNGRKDMIEILKKSGAIIDALADGGYTPLQVAAKDGHADMIEWLVKSGANINACTDLGYTALHESAGSGHMKATQKLLELGADPTIKDKVRHFTAANIAHDNFHISIRDLICSKMSYQQCFIQNVNYILHNDPYPSGSKQNLFIKKIIKDIESIKDADEVYRQLYNSLKSPYYLTELKGTLKPVVKLLIANMNQYNADKTKAKKDIETTKTTEVINKKQETKSSPVISPVLLSSYSNMKTKAGAAKAKRIAGKVAVTTKPGKP